MKVFAVVLAVFALFLSSVIALKDDVCGLEHSMVGDSDRQCRALIPSWTYDSKDNKCIPFNYGGCGGNDNRFKTQEECEKKCKE